MTWPICSFGSNSISVDYLSIGRADEPDVGLIIGRRHLELVAGHNRPVGTIDHHMIGGIHALQLHRRLIALALRGLR